MKWNILFSWMVTVWSGKWCRSVLSVAVYSLWDQLWVVAVRLDRMRSPRRIVLWACSHTLEKRVSCPVTFAIFMLTLLPYCSRTDDQISIWSKCITLFYCRDAQVSCAPIWWYFVQPLKSGCYGIPILSHSACQAPSCINRTQFASPFAGDFVVHVMTLTAYEGCCACSLVPGVEGLVVMGPALRHEPWLVTETRCACMVRVHEAGGRWRRHVPVVMVRLSRHRWCSHWWPRGARPHVGCWRDHVVGITCEPTCACTYVAVISVLFEATGQISFWFYELLKGLYIKIWSVRN
jgi:hypothetical protein